ncbi:MAG TPA: class II aldolase/adducin family protein [Acidimicrobiales bacterium]|nr:class II aldolase/adducin family protein [Acidimicrobiales bacterium]
MTKSDTERAAWRPRAMPGVGRQLTREQQLACAFRVLARTGFSENIAGHITWDPDSTGTMLVNPWGLWWDEVAASDVCQVDADGTVVAGRWDVTPAIPIHTELHRRRPDARVVVHNHPYHVTLLAAVGMVPEALHQTGSMFLDDLGFVAEYDGEIDDPVLGAKLADRVGDKSVVILANHGVIVTAPTIEEAVYRSASFERMCRLYYDVKVLGAEPMRIAEHVQKAMKQSLLGRGSELYWNGAVRRLLRDEPDVLD